MLQAGRFFPVAKPKVAMLHWLRLALSPRSPMHMPPQDVDFSALDQDLLRELAGRWNLSSALNTWIKHIKQNEADPKLDEVLGLSSGVISTARQRGHEAKARMLTKRGAID